MASGLVQHQIGFFVVFPGHALHREAQTFCHKLHGWLCTGDTGDGHKILLNQSSAEASGAKTLRVKNIIESHTCHAIIVTDRACAHALPLLPRRLGEKYELCD